MNELNQEPEIPRNNTSCGNNNNNPEEDLQEESIDFTLLRLDSFNSSSTSNANHRHTPCITCGCSGSSSSNKRRSPDPTPSTMDSSKKPKKLFLEPQENTTPVSSNPSLHGFSKISLPFNQTQTTNSFPVLRRCISDPCSPAVANLGLQSPPESAKIMGTNAATTPASKGSASLPPRPPTLRRVVSDPSPTKSFSRSSSSNDMGVDESPNYKWLKKMRDCMKEMNMWWNEILPEGDIWEEETDKGTEDSTANAIKGDSVTDFEEAVSVERTGDCLIIHFKCPCGKGYQILLSGSSCYYKLM